jgi:hypothetical protein
LTDGTPVGLLSTPGEQAVRPEILADVHHRFSGHAISTPFIVVNPMAASGRRQRSQEVGTTKVPEDNWKAGGKTGMMCCLQPREQPWKEGRVVM